MHYSLHLHRAALICDAWTPPRGVFFIPLKLRSTYAMPELNARMLVHFKDTGEWVRQWRMK